MNEYLFVAKMTEVKACINVCNTTTQLLHSENNINPYPKYSSPETISYKQISNNTAIPKQAYLNKTGEANPINITLQ